MAEMAARVGLTRLPDDSLPRDLSLRGTPFEHWDKASNVYEGLLNGRQIAVLDVRTRELRTRWYSWTILAVRTSQDVAKDWYGLEARRAGDWILFHRSLDSFRYRELMPVATVENRVIALSASSESTPLISARV